MPSSATALALAPGVFITPNVDRVVSRTSPNDESQFGQGIDDLGGDAVAAHDESLGLRMFCGQFEQGRIGVLYDAVSAFLQGLLGDGIEFRRNEDEFHFGSFRVGAFPVFVWN